MQYDNLFIVQTPIECKGQEVWLTEYIGNKEECKKYMKRGYVSPSCRMVEITKSQEIDTD